MKHVAVMTAYKDFPMLEQSLLRLRKFGVDVFLHIDRKSTFSASEMNAISQLCVKVRSDYSVPWGGYEHLEAIVKLMQDIVRTGRHYDYVHTISGQDVIVHSLDTRPEYWDGTIYMKSIPREEFPDNVEVRIRRRNLLRRFQKWKKPWQFADFLLGKVQDLSGLGRKGLPSGTPLHKGEVWLSLPYKVCAEIVSQPRYLGILAELKSTYIAEEFFFQTAIMNSPHASRVNTRNLRYTDWHSGRGRPAFLDETDLSPILKSGNIFARKFSTEKSTALLDMLKHAPSREVGGSG